MITLCIIKGATQHSKSMSAHVTWVHVILSFSVLGRATIVHCDSNEVASHWLPEAENVIHSQHLSKTNKQDTDLCMINTTIYILNAAFFHFTILLVSFAPHWEFHILCSLQISNLHFYLRWELRLHIVEVSWHWDQNKSMYNELHKYTWKPKETRAPRPWNLNQDFRVSIEFFRNWHWTGTVEECWTPLWSPRLSAQSVSHCFSKKGQGVQTSFLIHDLDLLCCFL